MPYSTMASSSRTLSPCVNTPTSPPNTIVTPEASAALKLACLSVTRGTVFTPFFQPSKYTAYASAAAIVGQYATPFCFMSWNTASVPWSPCSIVRTPASVARVMPSGVIACATTGRPAPLATFTS